MRFWPLLVLCAWSLLCAPAVRAAEGDVDGDGRVDGRDVELIETYLEGQTTLQDSQIAAADADGDGKITRRDLDLLRRRLGGLKATAPASRVDLDSSKGGVVVDARTGQPLAGVEVSLPDEGVSVRTDSEGRFTLPRHAEGKILSARTAAYAPTATTTTGGGGYRLALEKLSPRLRVLDDRAHHLGDDKYGYGSANHTDFKLAAEGTVYSRIFSIDGEPVGDLTLRIGSIIGLDTPRAVSVGQSRLTQFLYAPRDGLRVFLNNRLVQRVELNGDDVRIRLPVELLRSGRNEIRLETYPLTLPDREPDDHLQDLLQVAGISNHDDIEFAHLMLEEPQVSAQVRSSDAYRLQRLP